MSETIGAVMFKRDDLMARDWQLNGDIWTERASGGTYYVFRNY